MSLEDLQALADVCAEYEAHQEIVTASLARKKAVCDTHEAVVKRNTTLRATMLDLFKKTGQDRIEGAGYVFSTKLNKVTSVNADKAWDLMTDLQRKAFCKITKAEAERATNLKDALNVTYETVLQVQAVKAD
jgi:hypothetical protein